MKYSAFLLTLIVLAGCNGKTDGGGSSNQRSKSQSPVSSDAKEVVNSTDAVIQIDTFTKTIKVSPPAKEQITIDTYISDEDQSEKLKNCSELKYEIQFRKDLPKLEADQAKAEKTLEFFKLQKDDLERALKEPGHTDGELKVIKNQLVSVNGRITSFESQITFYKKKIILINTQLNKTKYRDKVAGIGVVRWTDKWDHNVQLIKDDNAGWNVEKAALPFKVKLKAKDLDLPAEYMIPDMSQLGLRVKDGAVTLESYYTGYGEVVNLSLYGACPLYAAADLGLRNHARIEIEVTFE